MVPTPAGSLQTMSEVASPEQEATLTPAALTVAVKVAADTSSSEMPVPVSVVPLPPVLMLVGLKPSTAACLAPQSLQVTARVAASTVFSASISAAFLVPTSRQMTLSPFWSVASMCVSVVARLAGMSEETFTATGMLTLPAFKGKDTAGMVMVPTPAGSLQTMSEVASPEQEATLTPAALTVAVKGAAVTSSSEMPVPVSVVPLPPVLMLVGLKPSTAACLAPQSLQVTARVAASSVASISAAFLVPTSRQITLSPFWSVASMCVSVVARLAGMSEETFTATGMLTLPAFKGKDTAGMVMV